LRLVQHLDPRGLIEEAGQELPPDPFRAVSLKERDVTRVRRDHAGEPFVESAGEAGRRRREFVGQCPGPIGGAATDRHLHGLASEGGCGKRISPNTRPGTPGGFGM